MPNSLNLQLDAEDYYLLRRPLLPLQTALHLHETAKLASQLLPTLIEHFRAPLLQEAIYIASPDLYAELLKGLNGERETFGKSAEKLALTLYKYLVRMSTRCTPYGLFAGCTRGRLDDHTAVTFSEHPLRTQSRLDMNYVSEIIQHLLTTPSLKKKLLYYPNNSLYRVADKYRYVEYQVENKQRTYKLSSVEHSAYLEAIIIAAREGCEFLNLAAIVRAIEPTASEDDAQAFIEQVIDSQLLVSELEPTITGAPYLDTLLDRLLGKVSTEEVIPLRQIQLLLAKGGVESFQQINQILAATYGQSSSKDLIQTDLFYRTEQNQLKRTVAATIAKQLNELWRLVPQHHAPDLTRFIKEFSERYESQEIPLLLALDSEAGIGYGLAGPGSSDHLPLLVGIRPGGEDMGGNLSWNKLTHLTHTLYHRALRDGSQIVELTEADLADLDEQPDLIAATPASLYALGTILAQSTKQLDEGWFQFALQACSGPSAANLLGRFCYGDEQLLDNVRETLHQTEPDTDTLVYAEVVHLPEARVGNILIRPTLRSYEIPFLSPASMPDENQIPAHDLLVSVRQGHVTLRSKRLNKQVIPRLSTAHNSHGGLPLYRFLCDIQRANSYSTLTWSWEKLNQQPFLPRIQYKHIILAKARWFIRRKDLCADQAVKLDDAYLRLYLTSHGLPRYFCLTEYDNELVLDSEQAIDRRIMLQHLEKEGQLSLTEFLSTTNQCFLGEESNYYTNEVILPLRNLGARQPVGYSSPASEWPTRSFPPGSEWVYLKLYGGTKSSDQILTDVLLPLVTQWRARGLIQQWFYIRYADPQLHLRVRFQLAAEQVHYLGMLLAELHTVLASVLTEGRLHKIQLDTYERELERYGPANIENSEALFSHDSLATASILALLGGDEGETYRWLLALRGLDELLTDFGLELPKKQQFLQHLSQVFFQEFKGNKALTVQLNKKYRQESLRIHRFLDPNQDANQGIEELTQHFTQRSRNWQPTIAAIQTLYPSGLLATSDGRGLLFSYTHMYVNRFILSQPRVHELTLYTLLNKYYTAQLAKGKAASVAGQVS